MNSEGAKTRRSLERWIRITGTAQTMLFLLLISPFVAILLTWAASPRVPSAIKSAHRLAAEMRPHVGSGRLAWYLSNCEEAMQANRLAPSNCIPPWLASLRALRPIGEAVTRFDGTNLSITKSFQAGSAVVKVVLGMESSKHPKADEATYVIMVNPVCSVSVPRPRE